MASDISGSLTASVNCPAVATVHLIIVTEFPGENMDGLLELPSLCLVLSSPMVMLGIPTQVSVCDETWLNVALADPDPLAGIFLTTPLATAATAATVPCYFFSDGGI